MIWSWIFQFFFSVLNYLMGLLPAVTDTSGFGASLATAGEYIAIPFQFIPVITVTLLIIVAFDIAFETGYLLYKAIYWVIRRFPTQS